MKTKNQSTQEAEQFSLATRAWAGLCHNYGICPYANRKPDSTFNKAMIWHREWCPGWNSHNKVYGVKTL
jgi:hypothetical protein